MKYYCVKQHDITDCGAACIATISKQYGLNLSISKIREVAGTDKQGTNAYGMIKAAEQLGFSAKGVKGNQDAFYLCTFGALFLHFYFTIILHDRTSKQICIADWIRRTFLAFCQYRLIKIYILFIKLVSSIAL